MKKGFERKRIFQGQKEVYIFNFKAPWVSVKANKNIGKKRGSFRPDDRPRDQRLECSVLAKKGGGGMTRRHQERKTTTSEKSLRISPEKMTKRKKIAVRENESWEVKEDC